MARHYRKRDLRMEGDWAASADDAFGQNHTVGWLVVALWLVIITLVILVAAMFKAHAQDAPPVKFVWQVVMHVNVGDYSVEVHPDEYEDRAAYEDKAVCDKHIKRAENKWIMKRLDVKARFKCERFLLIQAKVKNP